MLDYTKKEFGGKKIDYSYLAGIPKNRVVQSLVEENPNAAFQFFGTPFGVMHFSDKYQGKIEEIDRNYPYSNRPEMFKNLIDTYTLSNVVRARYGEEQQKNIIEVFKRLYLYVTKIENKSRTVFAHQVVGQIRPDFYADNKAYYLALMVDNIENIFLNMLFHTVLLELDIKEYVIYDLETDTEYRLKNIPKETVSHTETMVLLFKKRTNDYYARLSEKSRIEHFIEPPFEVEEKYKFTCPCKKGHIIITQSKDANDKEFKQIFGDFDCKECEKSYEIVDAMQNDFFLEAKFDVLNF